MGERVEEKKKQKQEALLMSAFELFTSKGINNTSISDIAKQAKMAKGTFYLYFKDKYDIRDRLIANKASRLFERAEEAMRKEEFSTLEEKVVFLVNHVVDQLNENKALMRFISKNLSWAVFSHIRISNMGNIKCMDIFDEILGESNRKFRQKELWIDRKDAVRLSKDEYFIADLIDMEVCDEEGKRIGTLKDVISTGANDVYAVETTEGKEVLFPAIKQCVLDVDTEARKMTVHVMEGLLDL